MERFSIECRKTKIKASTVANHNKRKQRNEKLEANTREVRENACDQVVIGVGFACDWLRRWRDFFKPITERSQAKPKQFSDYFRHSIENRSIVLISLVLKLMSRLWFIDLFVVEPAPKPAVAAVGLETALKEVGANMLFRSMSEVKYFWNLLALFTDDHP